MVNPQYHLRIVGLDRARPVSREKKPQMQFKVQGDRKIPFNVTAVWSRGQRITDLVQNEVVATSGAYTYGFASVVKDLAGTIVFVRSRSGLLIREFDCSWGLRRDRVCFRAATYGLVLACCGGYSQV